MTAPIFQSAATSSDGSTVALTYDETLSSTTAATTDFAVTTAGSTNTVTAVATSGANVELTLTTPVFKDQSVTVAYTDPNTGSNDANAVQDSTGNDAVSLSATTVTNNSTYVQGLQVELFEGINFDGLIQRQYEETIDLDDNYNTSIAGQDGETWSIRAYGEIEAWTTGTNRWYTLSDDRVRIWINDELAVNKPNDHSAQYDLVTATGLTSGQWYSIKIEFAENTEVSQLRLRKYSNYTQLVPKEQLRFNTKAPIFQSAATSTDGTKVVLTYDEALSYEEASDWLDAPNTGTSSTTATTTDFAVTTDGEANAVTGVTVSGATVELTLTNTVTNNETVTVSYTDPNLGSSLNNNDVNAIQGIQGNDAASITNKSVTNNSNVDDSSSPSPTPGGSVQSETTTPNLITTIDGNGLIISGTESSGTWVLLEADYSKADLQNSLQIISSTRGKIGTIGAISAGKILGKNEIYLEKGETLWFAQQSSNNSLISTPNIQLVEQNGSWQLALEDSDSNTDNDFNDLGITISTHSECQSPVDYEIAQQQNQFEDGLFDLRNINLDSLKLQITIDSSSDFNNRLAFVRLDDDASNLSLNGISASDEMAFKDAITGALIDPAGQRLELQGESSKTITWNLSEEDFGLYTAVMITEENKIVTIGSSVFQNGSPLLKSIGQNHFGFEDNPNFSDVDFDYNDLTFKMTVL